MLKLRIALFVNGKNTLATLSCILLFLPINFLSQFVCNFHLKHFCLVPIKWTLSSRGEIFWLLLSTFQLHDGFCRAPFVTTQVAGSSYVICSGRLCSLWWLLQVAHSGVLKLCTIGCADELWVHTESRGWQHHSRPTVTHTAVIRS